MDEHKIRITELYERLDSDEKGLSSDEAKRRLREFGPNILETKKKFSPLLLFLSQFTNIFAILLAIGSFLAFFAESLSPNEGYFYIGMALMIVVILNSVFSFLQQYQSERIMESFQKMIPKEIEVFRDNKLQRISSELIVPGDSIFLEEGEKIPADGRLIKINAMKVDHSSITGESEPQLRKLDCTSDNLLESRNMVFSGTFVQSGNGIAIIYGTGMKTQIGNIVKLTKETKSVATPLHKELNRFITIISAIAILLGVSFFFISIILGHKMIGSLIFAIGIIVANVPEGLPPTVTLSLSIAARRMAKKNALVRNLESIETLGSTTVICTDKTGTLTENKMSVNSIFINMEEKSVNDKGLKDINNFNLLVNVMVLCNNSRYSDGKFIGDPTETSLMEISKKFIDVPSLIKKVKRVHECPFDSKSKRMVTTNVINNKKIAYMKGAPEVLLEACKKIIIDGQIKKLSDSHKAKIEGNYKKFASAGERVLAFAYKGTKQDEPSENEFIFIGLVGISDPPREGVQFAIQKCKTAGIKVIMITGDHSLTAEAIARKIGLIDDKAAYIVTGAELSELSDTELKFLLNKQNLIFARTNPIQKLRIVKALQSLGEVVTVTGDGVNDAPALKNADMGVSMGISGTEVAREASDIVLMDDNFSTIVNAIEEGRTIFENIKKFIAYILISNVAEILPFIAFVLLKIPLPLTVVLILAIDLGTDLLPALGLGNEKPESDVMTKMPRKKNERLMTAKMFIMSYGIIGMIEAAAGFFSYFTVLYNGGWRWGQQLAYYDPLYMKATTAFFASIVICQITNVLIRKTRRQSVIKAGIFNNKLIIWGIITEIVLLALIIYAPVVNNILGTYPLSIFELSLAVPFAIFIFIGDEIRKFLIRKGNKFIEKYVNW